MTAAIVADELTCHYGAHVAVAGASFAVERGALFGFLGPNGAGKTTTIKMLCTLLRPTAGRATINGFDVRTQPAAVRSAIGVIFQDPSLDDRLTAAENLAFHAALYHVPAGERRARSAQLLGLLELADRKDQLVRTFSGGMERRLEIARSLMHRPEVLFLDEPTVGLDPQSRARVWEELAGLRRQAAVTMFLTTHYMEEAEQCDRVAIIDHGQIIATGTPKELKQQAGRDVVTLKVDDPEQALAELRAEFGIDATKEKDELRLPVPRAEDAVPRLMAHFGPRLRSLSTRGPSLGDVYLQLTGRAFRDEEATGKDRLKAFGQRGGEHTR